MIAAIYARKSTDQNGVADEAKSVTRQIEHARAYAQRKGWTVDDRFVFVDDGISGAEFQNRPGYMRLLNALTPRAPFGVLIVSELSRLGRELLETGYTCKQLSQAGVTIHSYLEGREILLDTPTDKFLMSAVSFAAEIEREKARQRVTDAMLRKARAGYVTGGRVFGYTNVRRDGHVERVINPDEAAVVRRIFDLRIKGFGQISIAKKLNEEGAIAPRSQQGRPRAWASTSVREVLYRELYRGVMVWNRTQKRNAWGQVKFIERPESEWLRVPVPKLRIISDVDWDKVHARLQQTREVYLRANKGQLWGRPLDGSARKYLLVGLARCGSCGGSLEVRSGTNGHQRAFFYGCSSYWRRGKAICANKSLVPLPAADDAVIGAIQDELLRPAFVESIVRKVLTRAIPEGAVLDETRATLRRQIADVTSELERLVEALAKAGGSHTLTAALKKREAIKAALESQLASLEQRQQVSDLELHRLETLARERAEDWRSLLRRHTPQARQILVKMLRDKLVFRPEPRHGRNGWRFSGEATVTELLTGVIPELEQSSQAMASPPGFEPGFQP